jgi:hypothetical protein
MYIYLYFTYASQPVYALNHHLEWNHLSPYWQSLFRYLSAYHIPQPWFLYFIILLARFAHFSQLGALLSLLCFGHFINRIPVNTSVFRNFAERRHLQRLFAVQWNSQTEILFLFQAVAGDFLSSMYDALSVKNTVTVIIFYNIRDISGVGSLYIFIRSFSWIAEIS